MPRRRPRGRRTPAAAGRWLLVAGLLAAPLYAGAQRGAAMPPPAYGAFDTLQTVRLDSLLDLDGVIERALAVSPAVTGALEGVRTAQSEQRVAFGEYTPTLNATTSVLSSNITSLPFGGVVPPSAYTIGLGASVDLYTGGRRNADRERADADFGAARATQVSQRFAVTLMAQGAFYETLRATDLLDVARATVAQAQQGLRYAQDRVSAGTATRSDELRAQLQLTTSRQLLVGALDTLQTDAYVLGRLVGANGPIGARRPASLEPRALALSDSDVIRLAIDASPAVQAARAQESADFAATRATRTEYVPDFKVTAGYNAGNQSILAYATRPGWSVLIGTTYPLFNGYRREDDVTRAEAAAEIARVTSLDVTRQARTDAARLLSGLHFAEQNIALASEAVQSAQEDLRVQTERYRAGISTELDQLTSEVAYAQAQIGLVGSRYNYQITRAQLEALVGRAL